MGTWHTYERQLGWRNVNKLPAIRGPLKGQVTEWFVKGGLPIMVPDQWDDHPGAEPLPSGITARKIGSGDIDEEVTVG